MLIQKIKSFKYIKKGQRLDYLKGIKRNYTIKIKKPTIASFNQGNGYRVEYSVPLKYGKEPSFLTFEDSNVTIVGTRESSNFNHFYLENGNGYTKLDYKQTVRSFEEPKYSQAIKTFLSAHIKSKTIEIDGYQGESTGPNLNAETIMFTNDEKKGSNNQNIEPHSIVSQARPLHLTTFTGKKSLSKTI